MTLSLPTLRKWTLKKIEELVRKGLMPLVISGIHLHDSVESIMREIIQSK